MKIVVACTQPSLTSPVAMRFERAPWFLIYDTAADDFVTLPHQTDTALEPTAGIQAAQMLVRIRAGVVIAGRFGESATRILLDAHICLAGACTMTAARAVADFQHGRLVDL